MAVYEGMFILDPAKFSRDPGAAAQQVADLITGHGGTVLAARALVAARQAIGG